MRILVTGSEGFVGRNVCQHFRALGHFVQGIDREQADILDEASLVAVRKSFGNELPDAVIHLAALLGQGTTDESILLRVNVEGTRNVVRTLCGPQTHFVFLSTGLVYGTECDNATEQHPVAPANAYARSKWQAETFLASLPCTIIRPSVLYGANAPSLMLLGSMLQAMQKNQVFPMTAGMQWRDFLHVNDAVEAIAAVVAQRCLGTFNVSSGQVYSIAEVAHVAGEITGKGHLLHLGALPYREQETFRYSLDSSKLRKATGWEPKTSLTQGLTEMWKQINRQGDNNE